MRSGQQRKRSAILAAAGAAALAGVALGQAQFTWAGLGVNGSWSLGGNWVGGNPPTPNSVLNFAGSTNLNTFNDYYAAGYRIFFNSGARNFTLGGTTALTLFDFGGNAPKIENNSGSREVVSMPVTLDGTNAGNLVEVNPVSGDLVFTNSVTLAAGNQLRVFGGNRNVVTFNNGITGGGSLAIKERSFVNLGTFTTITATAGFSGTSTYTGNTEIDVGTLLVNAVTALPAASTVFVGSGLNGNANTDASFLSGIAYAGAYAFPNAIVTNKADTGGGVGTAKRYIGVSGVSGFALNGTQSTTFSGGITLNGGATLYANNFRIALFTGVIADGTDTGNVSHSINKEGFGTAILTRANTYTGSTTVNAGTLQTDFNGTGAPLANILPATTALTLNGGTLLVSGKASAINSQAVIGVTLTGNSAIVVTSGATGSATFTAGTITRSISGSGVTLIRPAAGSIALSNTNNADGIVGPWATTGAAAAIGGTDWATVSAGAVAPITYTANVFNTAAHGDLTATTAFTANSTGRSLRFNGTTAVTATMAGSNTFTTGVLVGAGAGGTAHSLTGGAITSSGSEFVFNVQNAGADRRATAAVAYGLNVSSSIGDNPAGAVGVSVIGPGAVYFTGANTYTGGTTLGGGLLHINADAALGAIPAIAGTNLRVRNSQSLSVLDATAAVTLNANRGIVLDDGAVLGLQGLQTGNGAGQAFTIAGPISGNGSIFTIGNRNGLIVLAGTNTYTGDTFINGANIRGIDGVNIPANSRVRLGTPALNVGYGYWETNGAITRHIGDDAGDIVLRNFQGDNGGVAFSAVGGSLVVSLGGLASPQSIVVGSQASPLGNNNLGGTGIALNNSNATGTIDFRNPVVVPAGLALVVSNFGPGTEATSSTLSGIISGAGDYRATGGIEIPTASNTFTGNVIFQNAGNGVVNTLRVTNTAALGAGAKNIDMNAHGNNAGRPILELSGGVAIDSGKTLVTKGTANILFNGVNTAVQLNSVNGNNAFNGNFSIVNGGGGYGIASSTPANTFTLGGSILNNVGASIRGPILFGPGNFNVTGVVANGTGTTNLFVGVTGGTTGETTLAATNTYTGGTTLSAGTLAIASDVNLGGATSGGAIGYFTLVSGGTGYTAAPTIAVTPTAGGTGGASNATVAGGVVTALSTTPGSGYASTPLVTFGGPGTGAVAFANVAGQLTFFGGTLHTTADLTMTRPVYVQSTGTISTDTNTTATINSNIVGPAGVAKLGNGRLTLAGSNLYAGGTSINAGTLQIANPTFATSAVGTGGVTLRGGVLAGNGTVPSITSDATNVAGSGVSPGLNIGSIAAASLSLLSNTTFTIELNAAATPPVAGVNNDVVFVTGGAASLGGAKLQVLALAPVPNYEMGQVFTIVDNASGTPAGIFSDFATNVALIEGSTFAAAGTQFTISYAGGDGNDVTLTSVPEPASIGFALGLLGLARRRRR